MLPPVAAGVDGSAESLAAAEWAAREAVRRERALRLVHARDWHPRQEDGVMANAAQRHLAGRVLRQAAQRVRVACPDLNPYEDQVEGPATGALLKAAAEAELLVLGSRGLSRPTGFLVGSVALGVVARAVRPVVLVRAGLRAADEHFPAGDAGADVRPGHRDVLLGVDAGHPCEEVLRFAFEAARLRGARLRVLYAWHSPTPLALGPSAAAALDDPWRAEEELGAVDAVLRPWHEEYPGVRVLVTAVGDLPSAALVRAATGAGLVVVGHRLVERAGPPCTGPVTHAVIHHVGCPVAVVPHF
ncbi:universal stress protein [Streptomyces sp. NPDC020801]|uniref:universal stress protein n=1 Tax=unclassified Streptomyces TaxID=2593676 RepID=UPI0037B33B44